MEYDSKSDLWSIGVVFYQMLYGEYPFYAMSNNELMGKINQFSGRIQLKKDQNSNSRIIKILCQKIRKIC